MKNENRVKRCMRRKCLNPNWVFFSIEKEKMGVREKSEERMNGLIMA